MSKYQPINLFKFSPYNQPRKPQHSSVNHNGDVIQPMIKNFDLDQINDGGSSSTKQTRDYMKYWLNLTLSKSLIYQA